MFSKTKCIMKRNKLTKIIEIKKKMLKFYCSFMKNVNIINICKYCHIETENITLCKQIVNCV